MKKSLILILMSVVLALSLFSCNEKPTDEQTPITITYAKSADGTYAEVTGFTGALTEATIAATYENLPVTRIADEAFYNCKTLTSVTIPASVTEIGEEAFFHCEALTTVNVPQNNVTSIGAWAFGNCTKLALFTFANVNTISECAFWGCSSLQLLSIPTGVESIGWGAFYNCTALTQVVIPTSVKTIDVFAFNNCSAISGVYYYGAESDWDAITVGTSNADLEDNLYFYSETQPTESGNFWHLGSNYSIEVWPKPSTN